MDGFGGLLAAKVGTDIANLGLGAYGNYKNYQLQKENLAWQKNVQSEEWKREDNAVQRRVADLTAAGLSPVLAAGSAASAGPVVSTVAPRVDMPQIPETAQAIMSMMKGQADISQTKSQTELTNQLKEKAKADTLDSVRSAELKAIDAAVKSRDLKLSVETGVATQGNSWAAKLLRDLYGISETVGARPDHVTPMKQKARDEQNKKVPATHTGVRG